MGWPKLIELADRNVGATYSGTRVVNTWYIEPADSAAAFCAAMLGYVRAPGDRVLPAVDFEYSGCYANQCESVPLDSKSFSYRGKVERAGAINGLADIVQAVNHQAAWEAPAAAPRGQQNLRPNANIDTAIMPYLSRDFSAGVMISVTYDSLVSRLKSWIPEEHLQFVNPTSEGRERVNVINAGLRLMTPPFALFGVAVLNYYPSSGIAPSFKEGYTHFIVDRRMCSLSFNFAILNTFVNKVNHAAIDLDGLNSKHCVKFVGYEKELVNVPSINLANGEVDGASQFWNLRYHFDIRTLVSEAVYDTNGDNFAAPGNPEQVTWNHVLCHPGLLTAILAGGVGLGWWRARYSTGLGLIVDQDAFLEDDLTQLWVNAALQ